MVFISYASEDLKEVEVLAKFVETIGQKCWYSDRDLDRGKEKWMEVIMKALSESNMVLLYLTNNAVKKGDVINEITNASSQGKNVIPYIAHDIDIPNTFTYLIRKYEYIYAYKLDKKSANDILRKRLLENFNEIRESFWKTLQTKDYNDFVTSVMERYYGSSFFTSINNKDYSVFCVSGKPSVQGLSIKDFDWLCDFENSKLSDFKISEHQNYTQNKWYAEYSTIVDGKIRYPNRPGYMLDEITTDQNGYFEKMRVHIGTFAENVYSTHVLEYELYKTYLDFKDKDINDPIVWNLLKNSLSIRNKMHENNPELSSDNNKDRMRLSLLKGTGRDALLSVQMLVIIKSKRTHKYEVMIIQRSNDVVIKPGIWQFIPSGGFEILNDSDDDIYDDLEFEENFSPGCAIFREYLEEIFGEDEFKGRSTGSIEEKLLKDPHIIVIEKLLRNRKADLQFLGSVVDLAGLRHELSFVLVIHDESYSKNRFRGNEESKIQAIHNIPIRDFDNYKSIWKNIHGPSAAMWYLFKKTQLYHSIIV